MSLIDLLSATFLVAGAFFIFAGTVGLFRFRDAHSRLHALSKADNLGLGLVATGMAIHAESLAIAVKILIIWLLALIASAVTCYFIAEWEMIHGRHDRDL